VPQDISRRSSRWCATTLSPVLPSRADGMTTEQAQEMLNELKQIRQALEKMQSPQQAPAPDDKVSYKFSSGGFSMGDAKAPLVIVEYTDLQCPFCQQFHNTAFAQIKANYIDTGKVRFVSRDFPLDFHDNARRAATAGRCAAEQGKFWEMRHAMIVNADQLKADQLLTYAANVKLDVPKFKSCLEVRQVQGADRRDIAEGASPECRERHRFVIGYLKRQAQGVRLVGAQPYAQFDAKIRRCWRKPGRNKPDDALPAARVRARCPWRCSSRRSCLHSAGCLDRACRWPSRSLLHIVTVRQRRAGVVAPRATVCFFRRRCHRAPAVFLCGVARGSWARRPNYLRAWKGRDIEIVGVIDEVPSPGARHGSALAVERVLTPRPSCRRGSRSGGTGRGGERAGQDVRLRGGERWNLTVRLKRPHGTVIRTASTSRPGCSKTSSGRPVTCVSDANRRLAIFAGRPEDYVIRLRESIRERILTCSRPVVRRRDRGARDR
jgi:protein-disulfide isomerase